MDFKKNKIIARSVNEEKNNLALKIIPELISSDARLGISGSFITLNQLFEKKNATEKPNKTKISKIHKYPSLSSNFSFNWTIFFDVSSKKISRYF